MTTLTDPLLTGLTDEQHAAVTHTDGPCLVVAGAGTGKTRVLTHRLAYLVQQAVARPDEIVALTFTEKAATEMAERVDSLLPLGTNTATITTFHSFTTEILRQYAHFINLPADFALLSEEEELVLLREHLFTLPLKQLRPGSNPTKFLDQIISFFNTLKDEAVTADELHIYANGLTDDPADTDQKALYNELADVFSSYETLLKEHGYLTFGHCITETLSLLKSHPAVLRDLQQRYKYILIDEYQDTNWAQTELAALLAGTAGNIMVVGDDDQAIYSFRGAAASNLMDFSKRFAAAKTIVLTQNFRSTQEILDTAYRTIQHNNPDRLEFAAKIDKRLHTDQRGDDPQFHLYDKLSSELAEIAATVKQWLDDGIPPQEIAVLTRSRTHASVISGALRNSGVPVAETEASGLYQYPLIMGLLALMRLLVNPNDNLACYNLLAKPPFAISATSLQQLLANRPYRDELYLPYLRTTVERAPQWLPEVDRNLIERALALHTELSPYAGDRPSAVFLHTVHKSKVYEKLLIRKTALAEQQLELLGQLFEQMQNFEERHRDATLQRFINYLDVLLDNNRETNNHDSDSDPFAVSVMTIHKSKGLEFTAVIIAHCVSGRFPSRRVNRGLSLPAALRHETPPTTDAHTAEERRLFYVAATRAKEHLVFTASLRYGEKQKSKVSPFIYEAFGEEIMRTAAVTVPAKEYLQATLDFTAPPPPPKAITTMMVSHTNLDSFISCPLQYRFKVVLKVKIYPVSATLSFGISVHNTLRAYFDAKKRDQDPDVVALFAEHWISSGYETKQQENERKVDGLTAVRHGISDDTDTLPDQLEWGFTVPLPSGDRLKGRIDRIDKHPDGTVSIIDYKTGQPSDPKKARSNLQLGMYIYAVEQSQRVNVRDVTLFYVSANKKITVEKSEFKLDTVLDTVLTSVNALKTATNADDFPAKPDAFTCNWCDYKTICPFRYTGKEPS